MLKHFFIVRKGLYKINPLMIYMFLRLISQYLYDCYFHLPQKKVTKESSRLVNLPTQSNSFHCNAKSRPFGPQTVCIAGVIFH